MDYVVHFVFSAAITQGHDTERCTFEVGVVNNKFGVDGPLNFRGGSKPKKKEDKPKERREEGLAKPYDLVPSSSQQSAGGLSPEAAFMKEFLEMANERRIFKHRNVLHKFENKKKAIEKDNERWNTWVNTMKQEIQQQRDNHETAQKKLQKELNDLIDEEKKLREQEDHEMEEEDPKARWTSWKPSWKEHPLDLQIMEEITEARTL